MAKELTFQTAKVTSAPKEGTWSTAFEFAPPSSSEKASRGVMLTVAEISASPKFDAALAGQQIVSTLQENYYSQTTGGILPALERAVTAAHQRLVTLAFSGAGEETVDFNLVVGVLWGSVFYLAQLGEARAVIHRGGELKLIGHRSGAEEGDLTVGEKPDIRVASGMLEVGDKILLATPRVFERIPAEEIGRQLASGSAEYAGRKLQDKIGGEPAAAALAITLGIEGTPAPAEDALTLAQPDGEEAKVTPDPVAPAGPVSEEVAAETAEPLAEEDVPAMVEEPAQKPVSEETLKEEAVAATTGQEPPPGENLSTEVNRDLKKFGTLGQGFLSTVTVGAASLTRGGLRAIRSSGLVPALKKGLARLWEALGSPRTAVEGVTEAKNRRTLLLLAGVLLLILLIGVGINSLGKGDSSKRSEFDGLIRAAQAEYDEAQGLASLNRSRAKSLLVEAQSNLKRADDLNIDDGAVKDLQGKVGALLETTDQVFRVDPTVFYELSSLKPAASAVDMSGDKSNLYLLDASGGLYQLATADKKAAVLSSDLALAKGQNIVNIGNFVFAYVPGQGIYGYDLKTKKFSHTTKEDAAWGKLAEFTPYLSNVYVLDAGKNMIWRYTPISAAQFGPSTQWLKEEASFQSGTGLAVDGSVWVASSSDLQKFTTGKRDSFLPQDINPALSSVKAVYATTDTKNVYLLESGRVVVIDKNGNYLSQYVSDKLQNASALVVDEAGLKAYILADKTIYLLELKSAGI